MENTTVIQYLCEENIQPNDTCVKNYVVIELRRGI